MRKPTDIVNLKLRFNKSLRAALNATAKANGRSLNAEITRRLAVSYGAAGVQFEFDYSEEEERLKKFLRDTVQILGAKP
jgi:Arc-like DNA binding domain